MKRPKRWNPFRGNRKIAIQNAKRARIAHKGLAPPTEQADALIADAIAAGRINRIPIGKRTTRRTPD